MVFLFLAVFGGAGAASGTTVKFNVSIVIVYLGKGPHWGSVAKCYNESYL